MYSVDGRVRHGRIIAALMMREIMTRYGRNGAGFLWIIGEPLLFCLFVLVMWSLVKPVDSHGVGIGPFIMTGYMSMLLIRHMISGSMNAMQANVGLLYHRKISPFHIYLSRAAMEFLGTTAAFAVVYILLLFIREASPPQEPLLLYVGWAILGWQAFGLALILAALALRSEVIERVVPVLQYGLIPLSGAFVMAAWLPQSYREALLIIPLPHAVEMVRAGVFGEFVPTYFSPLYAVAWALGLSFLALILLARTRHHIEAE